MPSRFSWGRIMNKEKYRKAYDTFAKKMDAQAAFYKQLLQYARETGHIPEQYKNDYKRAIVYKNWRADAGTVRRVKKAARKAAKNDKTN